ncbi:hypothetical protein SAMN05660477_01783 [Soonwooa buanensis]|uniref:Uncharacterized protein n=1 Tax=Soonwooa buanensis TaxID=619805 RepID=A0A1T5F4I4_9FLAO|nr:hypothetical protein [Soonwooa buanensis]SKB90928.1 hypothetical protein SAMN05660477_01783 [Soonwooa buanensis]
MKNITSSFLIVCCLFSFAQNKKCNYIEDYYPHVYKAQIQYLKKNFDSAYVNLKKAEQNCQLIFNSILSAPEMLAGIEASRNNNNEAYKYLNFLFENGYSLDLISENEHLQVLKQDKNWTQFVENSKIIRDNWRQNVNVALRNEYLKIKSEDQRVRLTNVSKEEFDRVDNYNENRIKTMLKEYGYFNPKLIGNYTIDNKNEFFTTIVLHLRDIEYFKPIFFSYVKNGEAPPELYATLIDAADKTNGIFTYGIMTGLGNDQLKDIKNLDKRRISVGLRPWKMELEFRKLVYGDIQQ